MNRLFTVSSHTEYVKRESIVLCECYRRGSGSHEIVSILLEIVLTVTLHLSTGKAQKSR